MGLRLEGLKSSQRGRLPSPGSGVAAWPSANLAVTPACRYCIRNYPEFSIVLSRFTPRRGYNILKRLATYFQ